MKIDIERLKTDREYWDSVAPEGAEALIDDSLWVKWEGSAELQLGVHCDPEEWSKSLRPWSLQKYISEEMHDIIQQPEPKEWNGCEVPPVGWHGEMTWGLKAKWAEVVVLPGGRIAINHFGWRVWSPSDLEEAEFRPIRSERDKFIDAALSIRGSDSVVSFAAAMFDAGFRLPEDKQ